LVDSLEQVTTQMNDAKKLQGWTYSGITNISFSQVGLLNLTAGGNSSISIIGLGMYKAIGDFPLTSTFMAPAFLTTALGMELKPIKGLSILIAPLTGRTTIVANQLLSEQGAFNVVKGHTI